jgi:hypothetical protein
MSHSYSDQKTINPSVNSSFSDVVDARFSRRGLRHLEERRGNHRHLTAVTSDQ